VNTTSKPPVEVDFRRRETEAGWQGVLDRFGLAAAPIWFEWLEWVLVLGAFEYLAIKSKLWPARIAVLISVGVLWFYFSGFFYNVHFKGWFRIRSAVVERILSIIISGVLAMFFWYAAQAAAYAIAQNTK
jgi:hypothetical protein